MKKKIISCLFILLTLFAITGCASRKEETKEPSVVANTKFGWSKVYVPNEYAYRPDLRGLIYSEDERKLFIKGDPYDRSDAIIIDLMMEEYNDYIENYVNAKNSSIKDDNTYKLIKEKPAKLFAREKYEGQSGDTVIYNYTYISKYNDYIYLYTISGPKSKESELNTLKTSFLNSWEMGA